MIGEGSSIQPTSVVSMAHLQQFTSYQQAVDFLFPQDILLKPTEAIKRSFLSPYNMVGMNLTRKWLTIFQMKNVSD